MREIVIGGETLWLLDQRPVLEAGSSGPWFDVTFSALGASGTGLTGRSTRFALSASLRTAMQFQVFQRGADVARLENGLRQINKGRVAVPFWPGLRDASAPARCASGKLNLTYLPDWSSWQVFYGDDIPPLAVAGRGVGGVPQQLVVPLVVGKLKVRELTFLTPTLVNFAVDFTEQSPIEQSLVALPGTSPEGPLPSDGYFEAPRFFPARQNWATPPQVGFSSPATSRDATTMGHEPLEPVLLEAPIRTQECQYVAHGFQEIADVIAFFTDHAAGRNFWIPTPNFVCNVTATVPTSETLVQVLNPAGFQVGDWAAFTDRGRIQYGKVAGKTASAIELDRTPVGVGPGWLVTRLMLCRLAQPSLRLQWLSANAVVCTLAVRESSLEYDAPPRETLGLTMGEIWPRVILIAFRQFRGGVEVVHRFANYEDDVSFQGHLYQGARAGKRVQTGEIETSTDISRTALNFTVDHGATSLLDAVLNLKSQGPVYLEVYEASTVQLPEFNRDWNRDFNSPR